MKQPIGVIFDMDGVLVDSSALHFEAFQAMGRELGAEFPEELWMQTIGMHNNDIFPLWLGADLAPARSAELAIRKEAIYRDLASTALKPIDGVFELIEELFKEGIKLAVGSSGPRPNVELAIQKLGIKPFLTAVVTGDDVRHGKPNPEIFLTAGAKLALPAERCLVIEDAPQGVKAARAARMKVVAITTSRPPEYLSEATLVIHAMRELDSRQVRKILEE